MFLTQFTLKTTKPRLLHSVVVLFICFTISACTNAQKRDGSGKLFGDLTVPFSKQESQTDQTLQDEVESSFPVNSFLWHASVALLSKGSLTLADPRQGLLQTEWIRLKDFPQHRYRILVQILGADLVSQNLNVTFHHQVEVGETWHAQALDEDDQKAQQTVTYAILDEARRLYISSRG